MKTNQMKTINGPQSVKYFATYILAILETYLSKEPGDFMPLSDVMELLRSNPDFGHNFANRSYSGLRFMVSDGLQQGVYPGFVLKSGVGVMRDSGDSSGVLVRNYTHSSNCERRLSKFKSKLGA